MKKILICSFAVFVLFAGLISGSIAGHHYHGWSMDMCEMSELDSNKDGNITFEEFSAPSTGKLKSAFNMLDTDNDDLISSKEWDEFLKVHGVEQKIES